MYFDEEVVLDLRLNTLDRYIDYFVIVESTFTHKGEKRSLKFNQKKFEKFKDKIIYLIFDKEPDGIEKIYETDNEGTKTNKYILNISMCFFVSKKYISSTHIYPIKTKTCVDMIRINILIDFRRQIVSQRVPDIYHKLIKK